MAEPFLAEIRLMSFVFAPKGWALCNGQFLPINQNQALYSLLGTTFGGDGRVNFRLPDLRGQVPVHVGNGLTLGQRGGEQAHTLTTAEMPSHGHLVGASSAATGGTSSPAGRVVGSASNMFHPPEALTAMHADAIGSVGGSQPHANMQPYLTLSFCIALQGIFPSPT